MSNLLHEARIKLDWAGDNLTQLKFVIQQVAQDASNAVVDDTDASRKKIFFLFHQHAIPASLPLISQCVGNMRSALDYLVFRLAERHQGIEKSGTQFPICQTPQCFKRESTRYLKHLAV